MRRLVTPAAYRQQKSKKKGGTWGRDLGPTFQIAAFVHRYHLYRPFKHIPARIPYVLGMLFGHAFVGTSAIIRPRLEKTFRLFFPHATERRIRQLRFATVTHMGQLLFQIMLRNPNITPNNLHHFVQFRHEERLKNALALGKGVIMPSVHTGDFILMLGSLVLKGYPVAAVGNLQNITLFQHLIPRSDFGSLYVIGSTKFGEIKEQMAEHLQRNHIVFLMQDYANNQQLATPWSPGRYEFLIHTPQSWISLHHKYGSPIVPVINHPQGELGKIIVDFLDATPVIQLNQKLQNSSSKELHGRMSMALNHLLLPYILAYSHVWEEILNFLNARIGDVLLIPANTSLDALIPLVKAKCQSLIDHSYEPGREDGVILMDLEKTWAQLQQKIHDPTKSIGSKRLKIDLGARSCMDRIKKLILCTEQIINRTKN
jgi:KDO2-lipid IV(A) lauroyltransferase